jgi:hypothetical protein
MFTLRPYQREAVDAIYQHLRDCDDNPCVVLPTGTGKSLVIGQVATDATERWGGRVLVLAHVRELLEQNADKLKTLCPEVDLGIYSAGLRQRDTENSVLIAGIQSVYRRACELGPFDLVVVDEAHLIPPDGEGMYRTFLEEARTVNPNLRIIGLTATPFRMKGGMICKPENILIGWTAREIVLPTIPDSKASGAIIKVAGLTGRIRGMKFKRPDGKTVRPSLVVLDDPQTDESARSPSQCANRESILAGAVLGLAGPGKKISGIMPCTVIRPDDMADRILDRDKHPQWQGERTRMVDAFPENEKLWEDYAVILSDSLRAGCGIEQATEFYIEHREAMDEGARIAWPERYNHDEASAIQHAMNLKLQDEAAFWAEYQNEPLPEETDAEEQLTPEQIAAKVNSLDRRVVPVGATRLTAFIDVQQKLLFHVVCAWEDDFTGYVVDYGAFPDPKRPYFTLRDARKTLASFKPNAGVEGAIYAGLEALTGEMLGRDWKREDGAQLRIERCLIDANWGTSTDVVYQFCRQSGHAAVLMPSHGRFVGASSVPFSEYRKKRGDRVGLNWRIPNVAGRRAVRHVVFDTNYWKSFIHARLAVAMGDRGCLSLYGRRVAADNNASNPGGKATGARPRSSRQCQSGSDHRLLAEHLSAEYRVKTEGRGRTVDEWKIKPEQFDNHWFDGLVGCAVAASMQGSVLPGTGGVQAVKRAPIKLSKLQGRR